MSDINIQELDKSKIYFITVPNNYEKAEIQDILEKFEAKGIECLIARKGLIEFNYLEKSINKSKN